MLEKWRGVCEPKGHYNELIVALMSSKSSFRDIMWLNTNLVISHSQINF